MTLVDIPENPIPDGAVSGYVATPDGLSLRYARWPATVSPVKGTVLVAHGRTEFIEKYFEVVDDLRARGFAVLTFDWRGQGGSDRLIADDRRKGHVGDFAEFEVDLITIVKAVMFPDCPAPFYLLAHSTGGNVALRFAWRARTRFERIVLSAPLISLSERGPSLAFTERLSGALSAIGLSESYIPGGGATAAGTEPFIGNVVTSDRERHDRAARLAEAADDLTLGSPTIGWAHAACRSMALIARPEFPDTVAVPTLMVAAGGDQVVSVRAIEELARATKRATHVLVPRAQHEILMEQDAFRDQFWAAFDAFVPGTARY